MCYIERWTIIMTGIQLINRLRRFVVRTTEKKSYTYSRTGTNLFILQNMYAIYNTKSIDRESTKHEK